MKQEKWEEQLRNQLADYQEAAPDDLWADIEAQIGQQQPAPKHRAKIVALWGRRVAVAAAFVGLIIGGGYLLNKEENPMESPEIAESKTDDPHSEHQGSEHHEAETDRFDSIPERQVSLPAKILAAVYQSVQPEIQTQQPDTQSQQQDAQSQQPIEQPQDEQREVAQTPHTQQQPKDEIIHKNRDQELFYRKHHSNPQVSLSLYAQNGFGNEMSANGVLMSPQLAANYNYSKYMSRTRSGNETIYLANYEERQKHYRPISFGLVANFPISSRFSLSSGLVYTRLRSDFVHLMPCYSFEKKQTLYYLGVPLSAQYQLWSYRGLKVYALAGGQADYNLKAQLESEGLIQDLTRDRWQFSLHGALGVEYDIIPQFGLYVEPGLKHYFDNGSRVENYFKDKPTSFSLQLGVRLNVGR